MPVSKKSSSEPDIKKAGAKFHKLARWTLGETIEDLTNVTKKTTLFTHKKKGRELGKGGYTEATKGILIL